MLSQAPCQGNKVRLGARRHIRTAWEQDSAAVRIVPGRRGAGAVKMSAALGTLLFDTPQFIQNQGLVAESHMSRTTWPTGHLAK